MTGAEAQTLVGFLKGAFPSLTEDQIDVYESSLLFEDAQLASKAILDGIREWKFPPRYAEIVERIRMQRRAQTVASAPTVEDAIRDATVPLWVKRWMYARFVHQPPDLRPLREQHRDLVERGEEPVLGWMPGNEYAVEAAAITDAMARAKVAEVTGGAGIVTSDVLEALGPER
jgi:hypothetical protein